MTNTLLNTEAKNILTNLVEFTELNVPDILKDLKSIQANEVSFSIDELIKTRFLDEPTDKLKNKATDKNKNKFN